MLKVGVFRALVFGAIAVSFCTVFCCSFKSSGISNCCVPISAGSQDQKIASHSEFQKEMDMPTTVELKVRFDSRSVVAVLETSPERWDVFKSSDGGVTWRHDQQYYDIYESWLRV